MTSNTDLAASQGNIFSAGACLLRLLIGTAALLGTLLIGAPSRAQETAPASGEVPYGPGRGLRKSCQMDSARFCSGSKSAPLPVQAACLRQNWISLSSDCRGALKARQQERPGRRSG